MIFSYSFLSVPNTSAVLVKGMEICWANTTFRVIPCVRDRHMTVSSPEHHTINSSTPPYLQRHSYRRTYCSSRTVVSICYGLFDDIASRPASHRWWSRKYFEGSGLDWTEVPFRNLPGWIEENHEKHHNSPYPGRVSNLAFSKYKCGIPAHRFTSRALCFRDHCTQFTCTLS
jgi:hypothetical protein